MATNMTVCFCSPARQSAAPSTRATSNMAATPLPLSFKPVVLATTSQWAAWGTEKIWGKLCGISW